METEPENPSTNLNDGEFKIKKSDIKPMNDPNCEHEFVKDLTDETEHYYAVKCKYCPKGHLVRKS